MSGDWFVNESGSWCPLCGYLVARSGADGSVSGECRQCGYPDADAVADYYLGDDLDGDEPIEPEFDCPAFNDGTGWHCPLAGTEECDWECPHA